MEPFSARAFGYGSLAVSAERALTAAREQLGVRRAALFWLDDAGGRLACVSTTSVGNAGGADGWLGQTLEAGVGMAGRAVREGRPVWTPDLLADPRVPIAPWLRERLEAEHLRVVAAAPVRVDGVVRGALGFLDGPGRTYDDEALRRIAILADEVAADLARAASAAS
jgi:GAF domain-containing protein